ncbi:MAG: UDP-N-acetylmuramate--L-alanine ligase [Syntrophomonadaceae bacterium]|nr:UDP-N-acetylmuramate--L-alanine ligase [Syntrophomonadaceae bacterium]
MVVAAGQRIHMVGIGGAGMSGIARVLAERGCRVTGSDLQESNATQALKEMGVIIYLGHAASNVEDGVQMLVISSAIPFDNPELLCARSRGIPVLKRGQMLAHLFNDKRGIAIAGAHGKTTTTSMTYCIFSHCKCDPTFIVGGELQGTQLSARLGNSEYAIVEADESDGSFLDLQPYAAIVTNIEDDHLDYYRSLDNIRQAFRQYIEGVQKGGFALVYGEDVSIQAIRGGISTRLITYGDDETDDYYIKDWQAEGLGSRFNLYRRGELMGQIQISVPGRHNALNATAAIACALEMGLNFREIQQGIKQFTGTKRRFQIIGSKKDILIVDDYAHHPTEIEATLAAAKGFHSQGRLLVVFQPHRYSRTQLLGKQLGRSLKMGDLVVITDVYSAGEPTIPGISGEMVFEAARDAGIECRYLPSLDQVESWLLGAVQPGDLVITMGAGDVWKLGPGLLEKM